MRTTDSPSKRGGRNRCAACQSDKQTEIDEALVRGVSLRSLARRYDISRNALAAHKRNHVSPALAVIRQERITTEGAATIDRLEVLFQEAQAILAAARKSNNAALGLAAIRELRGVIELTARITGELDERPQVTVNLQQSAEWIQVQAVVVKFVDERLGPKDAAELSRRLRVLDGGQTPA